MAFSVMPLQSYAINIIYITDGWVRFDDNTAFYYIDGERVVGWKYIDDNWYYFDEYDGMVYSNFVVDNNKIYVLSDDGTMARNEWVKVGNDWMYADKNGVAYTNQWLKINNK